MVLSKRSYNIGYVTAFCATASIGGFLFGFDISVISGTLDSLKDVFSLNETTLGLVVASCIFGCIFGAAGAGKLADAFGRKKVLIVTSVFLIVSAIGSGCANNISWFVFFRLIGGFGVGAASGVAPIYIAEVAPMKIRGTLVTFYQLAIVVGLATAYFSNYLIEIVFPNDSWRWMFAAEALPGILFFVALFFIPETPRFLVKISRAEEAYRILCKIEDDVYARQELSAIEATLCNLNKGKLKDLLEPRLLRIVIIGSLLGIFSQISGVNAVLFYAPRIFEATGVEFKSTLLQSTFIGLVFVVFSFIPMVLVDRVGRKKILLVGVSCMAMALAVISTFFIVNRSSSLAILIAILCYVAAYAASIASITWVMLSELFPNRIRAEAMSVANICLWSANTILTLTFPIIVEKFGIQMPFMIYTFICVIIIIFVWIWIPETKGKSLEQIESELIGLAGQTDL